ncbi:MAG: LysM peptidoglycan-binding domain-containing protein [Oligoflexia bacterium]|nr:LysM peptidoglycan-binding domain-containing protein [Oligoflexia bacterium]
MKKFILLFFSLTTFASADCDHSAPSNSWKYMEEKSILNCIQASSETSQKISYSIELAKYYYSKAEFSLVEESLQKLRNEFPFNLEVLLALSDFYLIQKKFGLVNGLLQPVKDLYIKEEKYLNALAKIEFLDNTSGDLSTGSKGQINIDLLIKHSPKILKAKILKELRENNYKEAKSIASKIPSTAGKNLLSFRALALAEYAKSQKKYDEAESYYNLSLERFPKNQYTATALLKFLKEIKSANAKIYSLIVESCEDRGCSKEFRVEAIDYYLSEHKLVEAERVLEELKSDDRVSNIVTYFQAKLIFEKFGVEKLVQYLTSIQEPNDWTRVTLARLYNLAGNKEQAQKIAGDLKYQTENDSQKIASVEPKNLTESEPFSKENSDSVRISNEVNIDVVEKHSIQKKQYVVIRSGDTLPRLAKKYLGSRKKWKVLAEMNGLESTKDLRIGRKLLVAEAKQSDRVPAAKQRFTITTVRRGETLADVSYRLYGTHKKWKKILDWNKDKISDLDNLIVGQKLKYLKQAEEMQ